MPDDVSVPEIASLAASREDSRTSSGEPHEDLLESAWGVIANAGWDDCAKSPGWQEAAERWRDDYGRWLDLHLRPGGYQTWEELAVGVTRERDALFAEVAGLRRAAQDAARAVPALPVAAALDPERIRAILTGMLEASQADAVMLEVVGPLLESAHAAGAEPAPARLTDAQCDRLRQLVTEHQDALTAVGRALDLAVALEDADRGIIAAGRAGLKVLEGAEEEAPDA